MFNKKPKIIRWGIIGCGNVTEVKSGPAYQMTDAFELMAVMRRDHGKAADYARRHQVPKYYSKADDLIFDDAVDAVYIATPPDSHGHYALKVAKAGKACCIEKPMTPNYSDSLEVYRAFKKNNLPLFVAYYRRSLPRFLHIKKWLDDKEIGQPRHIRWVLTKRPSDFDLSGTYNWRTDATVAPGGYFDDLASHGLDLFVHLLGNIVEAQGVSMNRLGLYTAKDAITGTWLHEDGTMGSGTWNFGCDRREDAVEIYGSKGKISFSVFGEEDILLENERGTQRRFIENPKHIQQYHVENLRRHLLDGITHPSTGKTALHTSWVMDSILGNI